MAKLGKNIKVLKVRLKSDFKWLKEQWLYNLLLALLHLTHKFLLFSNEELKNSKNSKDSHKLQRLKIHLKLTKIPVKSMELLH